MRNIFQSAGRKNWREKKRGLRRGWKEEGMVEWPNHHHISPTL